MIRKNENKKIHGLDFTWEEVNNAINKHQLLSFDLEFSRKCNYNCVYCYANATQLSNELTTEEIFNIIDQATNLGAKNVVNIGGGEPLLFKDYWKILDKERENKLKSITFTNGSLITKDNAKKLFDYGENIALKFNSFNEKTQDFLAGRNGAGKLIKNSLKNLIDVGYTKKNGPKLALETIICNQNYHEIQNIYKFCRENNILPYIEILTEQGNAAKNNLSPTIKENYELFKKLLKYDQNEWNINWPLTPPIVGQTCKRMLYSAYIRSDGNVQPCPGVEIVKPQYNIRNNSLKWILENSIVFKEVRNIYNNINGPCKDCEHKDCYGCRGTALFQNNSYLASDPTCWHINGD
jgi:MoaA/NifB/PqqE/SkfB family radical SAM enzyme